MTDERKLLFPHSKPRDIQEDMIKEVDDAIKNKKEPVLAIFPSWEFSARVDFFTFFRGSIQKKKQKIESVLANIATI